MVLEIAELEWISSRIESGEIVTLSGWISPLSAGETESAYFALVDEAQCCGACLPQAAGRRVEVMAQRPIAVTSARVEIAGTLHVLDRDPAAWRYQLRDARLVHSAPALFSRRRMLAAGSLICAAVGLKPALADDNTADQLGLAAIARQPTVDIHTHAGGINGVRRVEQHVPFTAVSAPMQSGGMAVLCLAAVPDSPTHKVMPDRRIRPFRDPEPGELYRFGVKSFQRIHDFAASEKLAIITDAAGLQAATASRPSVIVASEGADFLEGDIARLTEAQERFTLRHLQLTHYRVNELGDIQTEPPVHGGLTDFGAEVIRSCNRLGIVVDTAHATFDLVRRAVAVTTRPLVLSHTSLSNAPGPRSRTISPDHARAIAGTGGVIGIWPPRSIFPDKVALAAGMARMVDVVGIDHVGLGSDMGGLVGPSSFADYDELPALAAALLAHGFGVEDVRKLLGGNYVRVFSACLA